MRFIAILAVTIAGLIVVPAIDQDTKNISDAETGLTSLDGEKLLKAIANQSAESLHYRLTWLQLRLDAANMIPAAGGQIDGMPKMSQGSFRGNSETQKSA